MDIKVPFKDVIKNKKIDFMTIDKEKMQIMLNYDDIDKWNILRIIPNKGMPYKNKFKKNVLDYGNLILNINIEFPKFDNYQRKILSGIL